MHVYRFRIVNQYKGHTVIGLNICIIYWYMNTKVMFKLNNFKQRLLQIYQKPLKHSSSCAWSISVVKNDNQESSVNTGKSEFLKYDIKKKNQRFVQHTGNNKVISTVPDLKICWFAVTLVCFFEYIRPVIKKISFWDAEDSINLYL